MPPLPNVRHEIFAQEIAFGASLISAYATAGFRGGEYPRFNASRLKNKPHVRARIAELQAADAARAAVHRQYLEAQLMQIVDFDPGDLYQHGKNGTKLRPLNKLPTHVRRAISRIEVNDEGVVTKIEFADRLAAATLLVKSLPGAQPEVSVTAVAGAAAITMPDGSPPTDKDRVRALAALFAKVEAGKRSRSAVEVAARAEPRVAAVADPEPPPKPDYNGYDYELR